MIHGRGRGSLPRSTTRTLILGDAEGRFELVAIQVDRLGEIAQIALGGGDVAVQAHMLATFSIGVNDSSSILCSEEESRDSSRSNKAGVYFK